MNPTDQLRRFSEAIFKPEDIVEVRDIFPQKKGARLEWHRAADLPAQFDTFTMRNAQGWGIYAGINPRKAIGEAKADGVALARAWFVDLDGGTTVDEAKRRVATAGLADPSIIIASGHGTHLYWLAADAMTDLVAWNEDQKALISALGGDKAIHDPPRVMRLPGFKNTKEELELVECRLVHCNANHRLTRAELPIPSKTLTEEDRRGQKTTEDNRRQQKTTEDCIPSSSVNQAIESTLPSQSGQRHRKIFLLARRLKALPEYAEGAAANLKPIIRQWHTAALPTIRTKAFDETWSDFLHAWPRVRSPAGQDLLAEVARLVEIEPDTPHDYECPHTIRLAKTCIILQRMAGEQPFFLSCRVAGKMMGANHETANKRLNMLLADGVLEIVERETNHRARRYRYKAKVTP